MPKGKSNIAQSQDVRIKSLQEEVARLKKALEDKEWASRKTNEGIKTLYKELEKKSKELEKLEKLKSDFVATVSHELRTPLSLTKESISLVLDEVPGKINAKQKDLLEVSADNLDRLTKIINDLLDISKIEADRVEPNRALVDFSIVVSNVCTRWKAEFEKKHQKFSVSLPELPLSVYIDPDRMIQVLHNLLSNALKYTPEEGKISVELEDRGDSIVLVFSDTGRGIAREDIPKVFSKFHQFGRVNGPGEKGTGLGLAICKEIIQMHGGTIKVESQVGKGTRFIICFPKKDIETALEETINSRIKEAVERKIDLSLIIIYIPAFNEIRQKLGYSGSHYLLKQIGKAASDSLRSREDTVMSGSDEFIVLLFDVGKKDIGTIKARIERAIYIYLSESKEVWLKRLRFTFGYATYPYDASSGKELLKQARKISRI